MTHARQINGANLDHFVHTVYLPHIRRRKRSWRLDERHIARYISPAFGKRQLRRIHRNAIEQWLGALPQHGLATVTCNRIFTVMQALFSVAVRQGWVAASPCATVKPLPVAPRQDVFLSREQANRVLARLAATPLPATRALQLLLLTGARKSEILQARWEHVHLENRVLTVPLSKSGKSRHIALSDAACRVIAAIPRLPGCPWLFPGVNDCSRPLRDVFPVWKRIREELELGPVRVHDLRHTFASLLVAQGHSLYAVQRLLGHCDPRTTMRYAHLQQQELVAAADSVGAFIGVGQG